MKDIVVEILKIVAPVSVALIVFAQGLGIAPKAIMTYFTERPWLMLRSLVAALVLVAAANFSPQKALPVLVPCVLTFIVVAMVYLVWRRMGLAAGKPADAEATS